ncbi:MULTISPECIES: suppressor of fused domain protein [Myxococcaceae]|uniref:suppressor of fused domain protein n=1 Tax=Myxococcaceae TaxID=31 RepID=UPI00188EF775|nr:MULTISPECIES: suppressor of fused domain protein [Myxococcaceae]MBF5045712.1 suppressor of fused domain protein [Simulacricoccus sp. 17bor-14]
MSPPSRLVKQVFREQTERYGDTGHALTFDSSTLHGFTALESVLVRVWPADAEVDVTTFMTTGMSERTMPGSTLRAELHLGVRGSVDPETTERVCRFLAGLAQEPWRSLRALDWGQVVENAGRIPAFPHCSSVLLHPRFSSEGWDTFETTEQPVKLLFVVPIPESERRIVQERGLEALHAYWEQRGVDVLADRSALPSP